MGNAMSALMIGCFYLQLLMYISVSIVHAYQLCLAIMNINGAATDKLFSNPMVKHLQSNDNSLHSFNQLMMTQMLSKNGKHWFV